MYDVQVEMHRRRTWIAAPIVHTLPLLLVLLAGCGATSTQTQLASSTGATSTAAADAPRGPQLAYLWDGAGKNLYPVLGVAGAARYGAPLLAADTKYVAGAVSGSGSGAWALLLDSSGTLDAVMLPSVTPTVVATRVPLDAAIVFAPAGAYAAVISRSANTVLLVGGLPTQTQVAELAIPFGGALTGLAVSDRGTVLAGWVSSGATGVQVGTLSTTGASTIGAVTAWGGAGFVPGVATAGQEQAVVADGSTGQLTRLSGIGGAAASATALAGGNKLQTPVAVAVSGDGAWAFAADSAKQQVVRVDLKGSTPAIAIRCGCQPARLLGLAGNTFFEVSTDQPAQPAWLLDGHALSPRTFFVPALVTAASTAALVEATTKPQAKATAQTRGAR